jgi:hypothetical protein
LRPFGRIACASARNICQYVEFMDLVEEARSLNAGYNANRLTDTPQKKPGLTTGLSFKNK